jgi:hypothetical protein
LAGRAKFIYTPKAWLALDPHVLAYRLMIGVGDLAAASYGSI